MAAVQEEIYDLSNPLFADEVETDPEMQALVDSEILDEESAEFLHRLTLKILLFATELNGRPLYPYQIRLAYRIVESVVSNDGATITALMARQSGKTETVAVVVAALMILLPRLATIYPTWLGDFERGLMVGCFAPVEEQAQTLFSRIVRVLTSDRAREIMEEPEIDDRPDGGGKYLELVNCKSFIRLQTANPRANIESKTYHLVVLDEAQRCDEKVVNQSIAPMLASTNGTTVMTGTPSTEKGVFYKAIKTNQRQEGKRRAKKNHYQSDYREVIKYNERYKKHIAQQKIKIGEESDEFQLSYALKWLLERGMFTTEDKFKSLCDPSMKMHREWDKSEIVLGIDIARKQDATVVTAIWVDWNNPDEFGYYEHRVLNWLEITGDQWEEQYAQVLDFASHYRIHAVAVDGQGMGDLFADRLSRLMPGVDIQAFGSSASEQSLRWKNLIELMGRNAVVFPGHSFAQRTRAWKNFKTQMLDAVKENKGPNIVVAAPNEADAHDDYVDSLALGCWVTRALTMPTVDQTDNFLYSSRSR